MRSAASLSAGSAARRRNNLVDRAAQHDDAIRRAVRRIPGRKAILQRQESGHCRPESARRSRAEPTLTTSSRRPARANRVGNSTAPTSPSVIRKLEGCDKKAEDLREHRRTSRGPAATRASSRPRSAPWSPRWADRGRAAARPSRPRPTAQFSKRSCSVAELGHLLDQRLRDHHRAVVVGDDDVAREHRDAAAADRLLPADEGEAGDRGRRGGARAPDRQARSRARPRRRASTPSVTSPATPRFFMRATRMSPKMPADGHAHGVGDRDHVRRHVLDRGARRARRGPGLRASPRSSRAGTKRSVKASPDHARIARTRSASAPASRRGGCPS